MTDAYEHWFDRLSAPQTRTRLLKSALAAGVLTLPFARPALGSLGTTTRTSGCDVRVDPQTCGNACRATVDAHFVNTADHTCQGVASGIGAGTAGVLLGSPVVAVLAGRSVKQLALSKCLQAALLVEKAGHADCLEPGCPGFDPCDPLGPCAYFLSIGLKCCPSSGIQTGYLPCNCCADSGDGCKAICG